MIVVCGEALFDVFAEGDTATGMAMDARIGGSPFNVAMGLARLGRPVAFLGAVGSGFAGQRLLRALKEEGIDTACTPVLDAPTTLSLVGLNAQRRALVCVLWRGLRRPVAADARHCRLDPGRGAGVPVRLLCDGGRAGGCRCSGALVERECTGAA